MIGKHCYDKDGQRLYLIENAYQNAFEYRHIFLDILNEDKKLKDNDCDIKLVSIGCGAMTDYFALQLALDMLGQTNRRITYLGCDKVNWDYKFDPRKSDNVYFYHNDAAEMFQKTAKLSANLYFFPKSTGEIDLVRFRAICRAFADREIVSDKFSIAISQNGLVKKQWYDDWFVNALIEAVCSNDFALCEKDPINRSAKVKLQGDFEYNIMTFIR